MQLSDATQQAIDARVAARAALLDGVSAGNPSLATVLTERRVDGWRDVRILAVLDALDGVGKVEVRRGLGRCGVGESTCLGDLTDDDAAAIVEAFG